MVMEDSRISELAALRAKTDRQLMAIIAHQLELAHAALGTQHPGDPERAARFCRQAQRLLVLLRIGAAVPVTASPMCPPRTDSAARSLRT
jgi:hypothetical protein